MKLSRSTFVKWRCETCKYKQSTFEFIVLTSTSCNSRFWRTAKQGKTNLHFAALYFPATRSKWVLMNNAERFPDRKPKGEWSNTKARVTNTSGKQSRNPWMAAGPLSVSSFLVCFIYWLERVAFPRRMQHLSKCLSLYFFTKWMSTLELFKVTYHWEKKVRFFSFFSKYIFLWRWIGNKGTQGLYCLSQWLDFWHLYVKW